MNEEILLSQMLLSHLIREAASYYNLVHAQGLLPPNLLHLGVYFGTQALEELEHYYQVRGVLVRLVGLEATDLMVKMRMEKEEVFPKPGTVVEQVLANILTDLAGTIVIRSIVDSANKHYARVARGMLEQEDRHVKESVSKMKELLQVGGNIVFVRRAFMRQWQASLRCLGKPGSEGDLLAVQLKFKAYGAQDSLQEYLACAMPILSDLGLIDLVP